MSVNYFAWAVVFVTTVLVMAERIPWVVTAKETSLLLVIGIFGSLMVSMLIVLNSVTEIKTNNEYRRFYSRPGYQVTHPPPRPS